MKPDDTQFGTMLHALQERAKELNCLYQVGELFLRTGYRSDGLLDVHLATDRDIAERSSFAVKIDAITDPARKLPMKDSPA